VGHEPRVEKNVAAGGSKLTTDQIDQLDNLTPATGDRHEEHRMRMIGR
jgi:hypothetical protein